MIRCQIKKGCMVNEHGSDSKRFCKLSAFRPKKILILGIILALSGISGIDVGIKSMVLMPVLAITGL